MSSSRLRRVRHTVCRAAAALALAALLVTWATGDTSETPGPRAAHFVGRAQGAGRAQVILVVGDSVAYGAYDTVHGGWVTRLAALLSAAYPHMHFHVVNAAGNGGNTGLLVPILRRLQQQRVRPGLVLVAYGLNDFDERVSPVALAAHLRAAVHLLHTWPGPPAVVLLGLPPITALSPARLRAERAYTDTIRRVARAEDAGYFDQFDLWLALGSLPMHRLRHDTEHPNAFGYAFTAASVAAFLEGAYLDTHGDVRLPRVPPTCAAALCGS